MLPPDFNVIYRLFNLSSILNSCKKSSMRHFGPDKSGLYFQKRKLSEIFLQHFERDIRQINTLCY